MSAAVPTFFMLLHKSSVHDSANQKTVRGGAPAVYSLILHGAVHTVRD